MTKQESSVVLIKYVNRVPSYSNRNNVRVYWNSADSEFRLNSERGNRFLGLNTPPTILCSGSGVRARRGEHAARDAIYVQRQSRSYLRQSHGGIVAS